MKKHLLTLLIFFLAGSTARRAQAQFPGGFFSQQATKERLMAEQIAGYQVYLGAIKTSYHIAGKGLTTAHDLKNGTLGLHRDFFNSLEQVAPVIQRDPKRRATDSLYRQIRSLFASEKQWQLQQKLRGAAGGRGGGGGGGGRRAGGRAGMN